jgi:hypothetical protein
MLNYDEPLSKLAFNVNLRRHMKDKTRVKVLNGVKMKSEYRVVIKESLGKVPA